MSSSPADAIAGRAADRDSSQGHRSWVWGLSRRSSWPPRAPAALSSGCSSSPSRSVRSGPSTPTPLPACSTSDWPKRCTLFSLRRACTGNPVCFLPAKPAGGQYDAERGDPVRDGSLLKAVSPGIAARLDRQGIIARPLYVILINWTELGPQRHEDHSARRASQADDRADVRPDRHAPLDAGPR